MTRSDAKAIYQKAKKLKADLAKRRRALEGKHAQGDHERRNPSERNAQESKQALIVEKDVELNDLEFLLRLPEFCPPELAVSYAPLSALPEEAVKGLKKGGRSQAARISLNEPIKRLVPTNTFERTVTQLYKKNRIISDEELSSAVLSAYGLKTHGELLSVLKREYDTQDGSDVLEAIMPILMHYQERIMSIPFIEDLHTAALQLDHPAKKADENTYRDPEKWRPSSRFEKFMIDIDNQYYFTEWSQVGDCIMQLYGDCDERRFATHILEEYGYSWDQCEYLRAYLSQLSYHLKPKTKTTKHVRGWLYYFYMRLWFMSGSPKWKEDDASPYHPDFNIEDNKKIERMDWDPEYAKTLKIENEKKIRKDQRLIKQYKKLSRKTKIAPIPEEKPLSPQKPLKEKPIKEPQESGASTPQQLLAKERDLQAQKKNAQGGNQ